MLLVPVAAEQHVRQYRFNGHPPLGVNATLRQLGLRLRRACQFQRAPTLGGECYSLYSLMASYGMYDRFCFNGHPPLGVNATMNATQRDGEFLDDEFQRAPTLGGECYFTRFNDTEHFQ